MAISIVEALGTIVALFTLAYQICDNSKIKRKKQASMIAAWLSGESGSEAEEDSEVVYISNMSELPIYEVVVSRDIVSENKSTEKTTFEYCKYIQTIPPGVYRVNVYSSGGGMFKKFDASISFRDVNGLYWSRDAAGHLKKLNQSSIDFRKLSRPVSSCRATRVIST